MSVDARRMVGLYSRLASASILKRTRAFGKIVLVAGALLCTAGIVSAAANDGDPGAEASGASRGATAQAPAPMPVTANDCDRTTATPGIAADAPAAPLSPKKGRATDPAWSLIDSISIWQLLKEDEHLAVEFDQGGSLIAHAPSRPFTSLAEQAIEKAPTWVRKRLEDTFSRLGSGLQDTMAQLILDAVDPYVDEIAWSVAHLSTTDLAHADFNPQLIVDNAHLLYKVDADVSYAEIIDVGDSVAGGDYYSTVRYKVKEGEEINEYDYPRDIYYWYIVHPRGSDELPSYIDVNNSNICTLMCIFEDFRGDPPQARFWREYFYGCDTDEDGTIDGPCPTFFNEQCDNDHDGTKDGPCPVLRDLLQDVDVLWEVKKDVVGVSNGAIGQVSDWVHRMLGRWGDKDNCRPNQPVVVYYCQDGNCGEYQDMQTAAGRTALIPTVSVDAAPACDHVWNEFYERRWIEWQAEDQQIDHPEGHDGWRGGGAGIHGNRGDGMTWSEATAKYTDHCQLDVTITDAVGYPVDGARVVVGSEKATDLCGNHSAPVEVVRSLTDANGQVSFTLGDSNEPNCRRFYLSVHTDWADYPTSGWTEVIHEPEGGMTYSWDHQFTEFSIPRVSVSPATDPADPITANLMEISYSVSQAQGHDTGYFGSLHYLETFEPGDVDFFIADSANYSSYTSDTAFEAFDIATDSASGEFSFIPPAVDDWFAVWANQAVMNFSHVVDTTVDLYENNGFIPPVCELAVSKGGSDEAILDWEDLDGINFEEYNVYRSTNAADVGKDRTQEELATFLLTTVTESTTSDAETPAAGQTYYYSVRSLGKSGDLANECVY